MPSIGLTTVAQVKGYLVGIGEAVPPEHEDLLTFLVRAQSEAVELFCRRRFKLAERTEHHTGREGERHLYLHQWPIATISVVTLDGTTLTAGTGGDQYRLVRGADGEAVALYRASGWESKPYGIEVQYTSGYVLPGDESAGPPPVVRTLPYDLERAVVELTAGAYLQRGKAGLTRESFEGLSVDFDRWPLHIVLALKKYRRPVI